MSLNATKQDELNRREALLQFDSVRRWLTRDTIRARRTKRAYLKYLAILVNHLNCTPDELVDQRIADMTQRDFVKREQLEQIVRELKREVSKDGESKAVMFVAAICSFMKANTGARLNINNPLPEVTHEVYMYEGEPDLEQDFWRRIVDHAPTMRDAALFMIGLEAGPRDGSVLAMTIGDVTTEFNTNKAPYKIRIPPPGESPMRKQGGYNFIAEDARRSIEAYISVREARGFSVGMTDPLVVDLDTGRPLKSSDALNNALRKAFLDAGALSHDQVFPPDVRMSSVRWYCLRKRTQTIMEDNTDGTGIALNWVDELLSHRKRGAQARHYSKPTVQQLRAAYGRAMHRLMIYRDRQSQVSQDQIDQAVQRALRGLISDRLPRELEKVQSQTISAKELARIFREIITVSKEAE
jgi:integrase